MDGSRWKKYAKIVLEVVREHVSSVAAISQIDGSGAIVAIIESAITRV